MTAPRTAKERVLAKWPRASCDPTPRAGYHIFVPDGPYEKSIGSGETAADAWASAARKLGKE